MKFSRLDQLDSVLQAALAEIIPHYFRTDRFGLVTVTAVKTARGAETAKVFVSVLKNAHTFTEEADRKVAKIQSELMKAVEMRRVPKITILLDETSGLIDTLNQL